ncbi:hypothetical protein EV426DRAFT_322814 [Tirmania nivea]|nr:hypothetical protein EV426DRAFT_322814 [Tirmania nivea]
MGKKDELVSGFLFGGMAVGFGYIGINAVFLVAIGNAEGTIWKAATTQNFQYAPWLFGGGFGAQRFWAIATAVSTVGSVASIMYTAAKVKQSMAVGNILPWSRLWIKQNRQNSPTAAGALVLHWIWGVISIIFTAAIPDLAQATAFPGFLQIYVQKLFGICVTFGYLLLPQSRHGDQENQINQIQRNWDRSNRRFRGCHLQDWGVWIMVIFLCVCNFGVVILPCIQPHKSKNAYGQKTYIDGYTYPAVTTGILSIATIYYLLCFSNPIFTDWSILRLVGLKSEIKSLCTNQRHPYFGYKYRIFITDQKK